MLGFIIIYEFVESICVWVILYANGYELKWVWWIDKYFAMNFIWKMTVMNLLVIKNKTQDN
jgi:hypothetical protein